MTHVWQLPDAPTVADVAEVRRIGARFSTARTSDQTAAAIFWAAAPHLIWTTVAAHAAQVAQLDPADVRTRVLLAVHHASRTALRIGERIRYPTPQALIRGEARSRNLAMHVDATWEPLLAVDLPSEAPCRECMVAGAAVAALRCILGHDHLAVDVTVPQIGGVCRRFRALTHMLQECEDAQVWGGLHLRSTAVESTELGLRLSNQANTDSG